MERASVTWGLHRLPKGAGTPTAVPSGFVEGSDHERISVVGMNARKAIRTLLAGAAAAEAGTGVGLLILPSLVLTLLLGATPTEPAIWTSRIAGAAMLSLAIACWPDPESFKNLRKPCFGMLSYNALASLVLIYCGLTGATSGVLLWPAVVFHLSMSGLFAVALFAHARGPAPIHTEHSRVF